MKKILFICITVFLFGLNSCEKDNKWGDGLPEMEHVYYIGFNKTNINTDYLTYEVAANGDTRWKYGSNATNGTFTPTEAKWEISVPFQFHSERVRSYNAVTNFWITSNGATNLVAGTDYSVSTEDGTAITPDAQGVYSITWPQTKKGIQNVKIKRLTAADGSLRVYVLDPAKGAPNASDLTTTVNNKTNEYEIRGLSFDYDKVRINFTK